MTSQGLPERHSGSRLSAQSSREAGQATVEFALVIGVVLLLFMGVVDFGRMIAMHAAAVTASREAARFGSAVGEVSPGLERYRSCDDIRSAARKVTGGVITLAESDILVTYDAGPGVPPTPPTLVTTCPI